MHNSKIAIIIGLSLEILVTCWAVYVAFNEDIFDFEEFDCDSIGFTTSEDVTPISIMHSSWLLEGCGYETYTDPESEYGCKTPTYSNEFKTFRKKCNCFTDMSRYKHTDTVTNRLLQAFNGDNDGIINDDDTVGVYGDDFEGLVYYIPYDSDDIVDTPSPAPLEQTNAPFAFFIPDDDGFVDIGIISDDIVVTPAPSPTSFPIPIFDDDFEDMGIINDDIVDVITPAPSSTGEPIPIPIFDDDFEDMGIINDDIDFDDDFEDDDIVVDIFDDDDFEDVEDDFVDDDSKEDSIFDDDFEDIGIINDDDVVDEDTEIVEDIVNLRKEYDQCDYESVNEYSLAKYGIPVDSNPGYYEVGKEKVCALTFLQPDRPDLVVLSNSIDGCWTSIPDGLVYVLIISLFSALFLEFVESFMELKGIVSVIRPVLFFIEVCIVVICSVLLLRTDTFLLSSTKSYTSVTSISSPYDDENFLSDIFLLVLVIIAIVSGVIGVILEIVVFVKKMNHEYVEVLGNSLIWISSGCLEVTISVFSKWRSNNTSGLSKIGIEIIVLIIFEVISLLALVTGKILWVRFSQKMKADEGVEEFEGVVEIDNPMKKEESFGNGYLEDVF